MRGIKIRNNVFQYAGILYLYRWNITHEWE